MIRVKHAVAVLAVASLAGATGCSSTAPSGADPSTYLPGEATTSREFFGLTMQPCTQLELDGYPTNVARASEDYYEGPWCARDGSTRVYLWAYARAMTEQLALDEVRRDVALDAEQLTLDLAAQGYQRVCGQVVGGGPVDVELEQPDNPLQIRVAAVGQTPLSMDGSAEQPLALVVAVGPATRDPAVPADLPAPPCPALRAADVTVTSATAVAPQVTGSAQ